MCHMDEVKSMGEYSSIFANYKIDEMEFSFRTARDLEKIIASARQQGRLIKKSSDTQTKEYAFDEGRVLINSTQSPSNIPLLRVDVIGSGLYQSKVLLERIGILG